jgi:hypothetical protein
MVQVRFWLKFHVDYGQTIRIIGGHDQLGEWQQATHQLLLLLCWNTAAPALPSVPCCISRPLQCFSVHHMQQLVTDRHIMSTCTLTAQHTSRYCWPTTVSHKLVTRILIVLTVLTYAGAWNLAKAPFLRWSEGDLWNVTMELAAGGVYEYK